MVFDFYVEYSTGKVVLLWQPPSYFSQWCPSSIDVDDVSYSCVEQCMVTEKARLFKTTVEQWSSSCRRLTQAHISESFKA